MMDDCALFGEVYDRPERVRKPVKRLPFFNNCVNWDRNDVASLTAMIEAGRDITYATFRKHVDYEEFIDICRHLGYERGMKLQLWTDCAVHFHSGTLHGKRAYWFCWSAIEYVFTEQ